MRTEIKGLHQRLGTTTIYVTHDQVEAMTMADKIVVMRDGVVEQVGSPLDLYDRPLNTFVAGFIGSPAMNMFEGKIVRDNGAWVEVGDGRRFPLPADTRAAEGQLAIYGIRPEHLRISDDGAEATVAVVETTGAEVQVSAEIAGRPIIALLRERHILAPGNRIWLSHDARQSHLFGAQDGLRIQ